MKFGDELILRASNERVILLGVLDQAGTLLVGRLDEEPFQVASEDVMDLEERASGCGCC